MYQKITEYVNSVFNGAPDNTIVGFTKKGFISSITKKYESNLSKGLSPEEAYNLAISQTPEIHNVAKDMKKFMGKSNCEDAHGVNDKKDYDDDDKEDEEEFHYSKNESTEDYEKARIAHRKMKNFSSIFWPLVVTAYLLYSLLIGGSAWTYSWVIFVFAAGIHCIVRFFFAKTPHAKKEAICASLWLVVVVVYLGISFGLGWWKHSWIIFPAAAAIQCLISVFTAKTPGTKKGALGGFIWLSIVAAYFFLSFFTGRWEVTWVIFIAGVAVHSIAMLLFDKTIK